MRTYNILNLKSKIINEKEYSLDKTIILINKVF